MRKSWLAAAWLALAAVATVAGLLAVGAAVGQGSPSTGLVLVAVASAAATVVGLGGLLLLASRQAVAMARSARDAARAVVPAVADLQSGQATTLDAVDDLRRRMDDLSTSTADSLDGLRHGMDEGVQELTDAVAGLARDVDVVAAAVEQLALDDARAGQDLTARLHDLGDHLRARGEDVDGRTGEREAPSEARPRNQP